MIYTAAFPDDDGREALKAQAQALFGGITMMVAHHGPTGSRLYPSARVMIRLFFVVYKFLVDIALERANVAARLVRLWSDLKEICAERGSTVEYDRGVGKLQFVSPNGDRYSVKKLGYGLGRWETFYEAGGSIQMVDLPPGTSAADRRTYTFDATVDADYKTLLGAFKRVRFAMDDKLAEFVCAVSDALPGLYKQLLLVMPLFADFEHDGLYDYRFNKHYASADGVSSLKD